MNKAISLGDAIKEFLAQYKHKDKYLASEAANAWGKVMGRNIAALTQTAYMRGDKLFVHLKSSVLRNELMMHRSKIINAINLHLGAEIVKDIILK
jgi:hypothetical protein